MYMQTFVISFLFKMAQNMTIYYDNLLQLLLNFDLHTPLGMSKNQVGLKLKWDISASGLC
jgi:hypothetical protein